LAGLKSCGEFRGEELMKLQAEGGGEALYRAHQDLLLSLGFDLLDELLRHVRDFGKFLLSHAVELA
jgi:hypothetical protein